jgi:hypothetical protein
MPRLKDLEAELLWQLSPTKSFRTDCPTLAEAQGVLFLCPVCFAKNKGSVGTHSVICWFNDRGVLPDVTPGPGRWNPTGTCLDDLSFGPPGAFSVWLNGEGCGWHGFVKNGEAN